MVDGEEQSLEKLACFVYTNSKPFACLLDGGLPLSRVRARTLQEEGAGEHRLVVCVLAETYSGVYASSELAAWHEHVMLLD